MSQSFNPMDVAMRSDFAVLQFLHGQPATAARLLRELADDIDALRPDDPHNPINLAGSGPVPIEPREG